MRNDKNLKGILLVALSAVSYGFMPVFAKMAYASGTSTYTLLFLRFTAAAVFMFVLMYAKKMKLPSLRQCTAFFLLGAVGYVGQSFCYFTALNYASSSVVSLLLYTYPAMVMLGSAVCFKERITTRKVISLLFALTGAFIIIGGEFETNSLGIILSVLCAVVYTIYVLVSSRIIPAGMSVQSSAFIMLGTAVVYGLMNLIFGFTPPDNSSGYMGVILLALVSTVIAFWSFFAGMEITGPSTASLISILEPVVTVVSSVIFLSDPLTFNIAAGGCLVLGALIITAISTHHS